MKNQHDNVRRLRRSLPGMALVAAAALVACGGSNDAAITPPVTPPPSPAAPVTPAAPALSAQIAARTHYFGLENVDQKSGEIRKDLVVMSWLSNTTYAAAINGKVVLLDASLLRRQDLPEGRTPTTLEEMTAAMPSYILVGKAAPGYTDLAAHIAFKAGATLIGTQEQCDAMETDAKRQQAYAGTAQVLKCSAIVPRGQPEGRSVSALPLADLGACVRAIKQTDASVANADPSLPPAAFDWSADSDLRDIAFWPPGQSATDGVGTSAAANTTSLVYHLTLGGGRNFAITWHDRSGSFKELAPAVAAQLRTLPKTDVHIGSVDVGNPTVNGLRDAAYYLQAVDSKIFFLSGQDAAAQRAGAYNTSELVKRELQNAMAHIGMTDPASPELRVNFDPYDYIKPHYMTFDPAAPAWQRASDRISSTACE